VGGDGWVGRQNNSIRNIVPMVGAAGFEPTTPRTPSECATGLRYAPTYSASIYFRSVGQSRRSHGTVQGE
jgi:hypothetical protein